MGRSELAEEGTLARTGSAHALDTFVDVLQARARESPSLRAFTFLADGEQEEAHLTYAELDRRARSVAAALQADARPGDRALLLYPPGLDYVAALFGCLYAGVVAVPANPPRSTRVDRLTSLRALVDNAQPSAVLTTSRLALMVPELFASDMSLRAFRGLATDALDIASADTWAEVPVDGETLAIIQYTSGSTTVPRGVMLTHENLLHNSRAIRAAFKHTPDSRGVIWLPPYHDMGLIGGILQPVYAGFPIVLMTPFAFLQRPIRWLEAISRHRATTSGGPNFAYELCVRRATSRPQDGLDLSSWDVAFNGAEPVRHDTLERFVRAFSPHGFRPEAFYPCYGLAEATLMVSGGSKAARPVVRFVERSALQAGQVVQTSTAGLHSRALVGCGGPALDQDIVVVDPESRRAAEPGRVGEIWLAGPSVSRGYWGDPAATAAVFEGRLAETGEGPYLRTRDLGFLDDGEVIVTGRLDDVMVIHGRNHYPEDLEWTAQRCHPSLRSGIGAAFLIEVEGEPQLVVVHEVERHCLAPEGAAIAVTLRRAVVERHEVSVHAVILVKAATLPKTPSGKVQRYRCRERFGTGSLAVLHASVSERAVTDGDGPVATRRPVELTPAVVEEDVVERLAGRLGVSRSHIDPCQPLESLGIDSLGATELSLYVAERFSVTLSLDWFFQGLTLRELADAIVAESESADRTVVADRPRKPDRDGWLPSSSLDSGADGRPPINLGSRHTVARMARTGVLDRARAFELPDQLRRAGLMPYFTELARSQGPTCELDGRPVVMLGANDYLGLTADPRVRRAAAVAALAEGPSVSGSRLFNGSTPSQRQLERKLAAFLGREDALIFTTGYQANIGLLSAVMGEDAVLVLDSDSHASVYDGAYVARCRVVQFRHADARDLERRLEEIAHRAPTMVMVDGVYSMTGELASLPELRAICDRHGATLAVDDAHGLGVLGATGRGTEEHFAIRGCADVLTGTMSKSLASIGGWLAAEAKVVDWTRFYGRSMLFSAAIPPPSLAAASAALDILVAEPWRLTMLWENARYWHRGLEQLGFQVMRLTTPIVPVLVGDELSCITFGRRLLDAGVYVNPVVAPAVRRGSAMLRTSVMANHTREHLDRALEIFDRVARTLPIRAG